MQPPVRLLSMLSLILALFFLSACGKKEVSYDPPAAERFGWGQSLEATATALAGDGWQKKHRVDDQLRLVMPVDEEFQQAAESFAGAMPENYSVTLFGQDNKLVLADLQRRDRDEVMQEFWEKLRAAYQLDKEIWQSAVREQTTAAGNKIRESVRIYETDTLFVVAHRSQIEPAEKDMQAGANVSYELRLLSKKDNEGLTGEALIESTKAGIR